MYDKTITLLCIVMCLLFIENRTAYSSDECPQFLIETQCERITGDNAERLTRLEILGWGSISDLAWSPTGDAIAVATLTGVWLYDPANPESNPAYRINQNGVTSINYSANGEILLSTSFDRSVTLWDANSGEEIHRFTRHSDTTNQAKFIAQDEMVISGSNDGAVIVWDIESGAPVLVLQAELMSAIDIDYRPDPPLIAVANSTTGSVMLFDSVTGQIESILGLHERSQDIGAIAFSPDGSILASAGGDGVIFWNMNDNAPIPTNLPSVGAVNTIEFSIDGSMLGYGDTEGNVHIWNVETNRVAKVAELGSWITAVKFSPDNTKLAVTTSDGTIVVWDIIDESVESETHFGPGYSVNDANFSPDSNLLVSGGDDRVIRLWDVQSSTELTTFQGDSTVETVIFSPTDAPLIASGNSDGTVTLWDVSANERVSEFGNSRVLDQSIVFDSTGERLVSLNDGVTVWNVEDETELFNIDIDYEWPINTVALNPSDDIIAFATIGDGVIYLWEGMSIENEPIVLGVHGSPVSAIAFNSEGNLLVTAGQNILKLWNLETHQLIYTNNSNSGEIADVDFNSDGSLLIFSKGSSFRILNVQDRTERVMLEANYGGIRSVDFSSDGTLIATAGYDGTIQLWGIASTCED